MYWREGRASHYWQDKDGNRYAVWALWEGTWRVFCKKAGDGTYVSIHRENEYLTRPKEVDRYMKELKKRLDLQEVPE